DAGAGDRRGKGSVVAVVSRAPGDSVAASIRDCEIYAPNQPGFTAIGPSGHGIATVVRDASPEAGGRSHDGATLRLDVSRSVVHATQNGSAVFIISFASRASTNVALSH